MPENLEKLPLNELRQMWAIAWGRTPHGTMGRTMMIESLKYKRWEQETGGLKTEQQSRLNELIKAYKRNPESFEKMANLKPGTRLVRIWKNKKHCVTVIGDGFEYDGQTYKSLSKIANEITGKHWNGWTFFGIKNASTA